jgi:DNA-binding MarR family transcriptional regulator
MNEVTRDVAITETMQSLRRIFKAIQDYSQEVHSKFGITGPQLWVLRSIADNDGLPLGKLSKMMYLHPSTVTGVIDRLEAKGHVERDRDRADRRVVKVRLTSTGAALVKEAPSPIQGKMIYGLRKLRRKDLDVIYQSVQKLAEIAEAENVKATFFFHQE